MLKLKNVTKNYGSGSTEVRALKNINICFRNNEFVAVLGHSGCGKTTMLNLIGGLDQYTSGDLIINGKSTKEFRDRDWDTYRNHSIGFVFQSYNLIPHQTVLANVELALTLSGVSKAERRRRAREALEKVGLKEQLHKRPSQMSGGQMQRVAIARALVNNPDILMADEPTGALDSETSVQIMDILKEVAKDRLVIMVTHNPDLADKYATRIVRLKDGEIVDDTNPYSEKAEEAEVASRKKQESKGKKPSMSMGTAMGLSTNNLMTKKGRTALTAFAGAIGIIGIALILSLSHGIQTYIDQVQKDTLSAYPITIQKETADMTALMTAMMGIHAEENSVSERDSEGRVYSSSVMFDMINSVNSVETQKNDVASFKEYLDDKESAINTHVSAVQYGYDLNMDIYTKDTEGNIIKSDVMDMLTNSMENIYGSGVSGMADSRMSAMSNMSSFGTVNVWQEMLSGEDGELVGNLIKDQYDLICGEWPSKYDEVVLVMDQNNELSDVMVYALGLRDVDELNEIVKAAMEMDEINVGETASWSYDELLGKTYKMILPSEYYQKNANGVYVNMAESDTGLEILYNSSEVGTELKIVGIIRPDEDAAATTLTGAIGYTSALTNYVLDTLENQEIINEQMADPATDVISGLPFASEDDEEPTDAEKKEAILNFMAELEPSEKAEMYLDAACQPTKEFLDQTVAEKMNGLTREDIIGMMTTETADAMGIDVESMKKYIADMDDETLFSYVEESMRAQITEQYAESVKEQMKGVPDGQVIMGMEARLSDSQYVYMYDTYMPPVKSDSTYEDTLTLLGYVDRESPATINIYANTFEDKDAIADCIEDYNETKDAEAEINYTDYVAMMMSSVTTIINAISYVLIAFVAISLIVSSIMIAIITYISVLERIKEIGILRAIGASKRDISHVFNAETLIEGFTSGVFAIGFTALMLIPINSIIHKVTGIENLNAILPAEAAVILVLISMLLTFIAGLIPARMAAKKDPVEALRSE